MTRSDAIEYYGTQKALADALDLTPPTIAEWGVIPALRQIQIEILTGGALRADPECYGTAFDAWLSAGHFPTNLCRPKA